MEEEREASSAIKSDFAEMNGTQEYKHLSSRKQRVTEYVPGSMKGSNKLQLK